MRKAALIAVSVMGLAITTTASVEAQVVVASVPLRAYMKADIFTEWSGGSVYIGPMLMSIYEEEQRAATRNLGYGRYGDIGWVFDRSLPGLVPLHRYRNRDNGDYFYTTNEAEGTRAVTNFNYVPEGICCYLANTQLPGTTPLFRLVNPEHHLHYYTPSTDSRDQHRYEMGWELEGTEGYIWPEPATLPAPIVDD